MSSHTFITVFFVIIMIASFISPGMTKNSGWKMGDPIVTYWAGPANFMELDDRAAEQIAAGGWNLGWARDIKDLDTYHRHGIRAMLIIDMPDINDPVQADMLDKKIKSVRNHPALYAYHITDEPSTALFSKLGKLAEFVKERDPNHLCYINLLPVDAPVTMLGTSGEMETAYKDYVEQFVKTVKPQLLSYDYYNFLETGDGDNYFLNLSMMRSSALKAKIPFMNIVQAIGWPGYRQTDANQMRWLAYTTLAYGGLGISHFRYDMGFWQDPATPKPLYWPVSRINRDFLAIAKQLQPLKSIAAYHSGSIPKGGTMLPAQSPFTPDNARQNLLLGYFGKSANKPTCVLVVNLDYINAIETTINCPGEMEIFDSPTQTWIKAPDASNVKLSLLPGGGTLLRLQNR